ncbi:hypothetical protein Hdeb2414_s0004g00141861 [Helianthus debilis subsp. tardiflorus]
MTMMRKQQELNTGVLQLIIVSPKMTQVMEQYFGDNQITLGPMLIETISGYFWTT